MADVKKLKDFAQQMDWEGGWDGITRHGHDGSGDDKLDNLLEQLEVVLNALDNRWDELNKVYDLTQDEDEHGGD